MYVLVRRHASCMASFAEDWRVANHGDGILSEADAGSEATGARGSGG